MNTSLSDAEYDRLTREVLGTVEANVDAWLQTDVVDIDSHRTGGLLELTFPNGAKIVINTQPPLHEVWLAARTGGHHFKWREGRWCDTRDGVDLFERLSSCATAEAGKPLRFA